MKMDPIVRPNSLSNIAYERIRNSILSGNMEPGMIYTENEIATQMNVSRTPVREALRLLTKELFMTSLPGRGYKVNRFSARDILEIYEFRTMLEVAVVKKIAKNVSSYNLSHADRLILELSTCVEKDDYDTFVKTDRSFHSELSRLCDNSRMENVLDNTRDILQIFVDLKYMASGRGNEVIYEHEKINECLKQGNVSGAEEAMENHLNNSLTTVLDILRFRKSLIDDIHIN